VDFEWTIAIASDPHVPNTVYAGDFGGTLRKYTGTTAADITGNLDSFHPKVIAVSPHSSARILVENPLGLNATSNGGLSWSRSDAGILAANVSGFASSPAGGPLFLEGPNLGVLEEGSDAIRLLDTAPLYSVLGTGGYFVGFVARVNESGSELLAAAGNGIARTINGGRSWTRTGFPYDSNDPLFELTATSTSPSIYYASTNQMLRRSTDQGASWHPIMSGLPAGFGGAVIAVAPSNPSILYIGPGPAIFSNQPFGLYKSTNGGDSWLPVRGNLGDYYVEDIAIHPTNPDIVYASALAGSIIKTVDGGASWTLLPRPSGLGMYKSVLIDPRTPSVVYAAGGFYDDVVVRSTDEGATWESLTPREALMPWGPTALSVDLGRPDTLRVATGSAGVHEISIQPDLAIEASALPANIPLLAPVPYQFTIRNLGPFSASGVGAVIQLPVGAQAVTAQASTGTCSVSGTTVVCTARSLNARGSILLTATATPPAAGAFRVTGSVTADQTDLNTSNNSVSQANSVAEQTDLGVSIQGPGSAAIGASLQYIVSVRNAGPSPATAVRATYQAPAGMTLGTFNAPAGSCSKPTAEMIACDFATVQSGSAVSLTIAASVATAGTYQATAAVTGSGSDGALDNNSAAFSTTVSASPPPGGGNNSGTGGGGGGGALSPLFLLALAALCVSLQVRRRAVLSRALVR
jgi:uncharacterized repeat protein (TIGR01451 family)